MDPGRRLLLKHLKKELPSIGKRTGDTYYDGTLLEKCTGLSYLPRNWHGISAIQKSARNGYGHSRISIFLRKYRITIILFKTNDELISFLGFQDLLHQSVHTLSGGQKQLVEFSCRISCAAEVTIIR